MAVILTSEFTSNGGYDYKIEIDEVSGLATANTFKVNNVSLDYDSETDAPTGQIISSSLKFSCWNEGGYFNSTFIPALVQAQQNTFRVLLYKDEGGGYELEWFGWIMQDVNSEQEAAQPRIYTITAVDGLSILTQKEYNNVNTDAAETTPFYKLLINALAKNNLSSLLTTGDAWLTTSVDWWEDSMTYGTTTDPLTLAFIDVRVWNIFNEYWEREYVSAYDIIKQCCVTFGARLYLAGGSYRFEQFNEREGTTQREIKYAYDYSVVSSTDSASHEVALSTNNSLLNARAKDNQFDFLPAIKRCEVDYERLFLSRNFGQFNYTDSSNASQDVGYLAIVDDVGLDVVIDYFGIASGNLSKALLIRMKIDVTITVTPTSGSTYYYTNDDEGSWTTTSSTFTFYSTHERVPELSDFQRISGTFNLITPELPVDGNIAIRIVNTQFEQKTGIPRTWGSVTPTSELWTMAANVSLADGEFEDTTQRFYATTTNSSIGDEEILNIGTTNVGDGDLQTGKIWVKASGTSGTISKSENWRKGNSGSYQRILDLLVESTQAYYHEPLKLYDGDIYLSEGFQTRINFDSEYYLFMNGSWNLIDGIWSGRWWRIDADTTGISSQTKLINRRRLFTRPKANAQPNELPNGIIGNVEFESDSGQFEGLVEFELTSAMIAAGQTGTTVLNAQGAGTYIDVTHVVVTVSSGTTPYATAGAQIYFSSETTTVCDSTALLDAINNGFDKRLNGSDGKLWANEALLFDINSDATGDYEYVLKVYYKLIS